MRFNEWKRTAVLLCAIVATASSGALADGATLKVKVNWQGKPYRPTRMKNMNAECKGFHAGTAPRKESVVTNENGTFRNVFVYVANAPAGDYPVPAESVLLDQVGCVYVPHVLGIRVGQTLEVHNGDPTAHNIHFMPKRNKEVNKSQPKKGLIEHMTFKRAEIMVPVKCDVHPWMSAYVGVMDHPFFGATGEDGVVTIEGLPGGTYELVAWHEKYGKKKLQVTVATGESKDVEFTYSRPAKKKKKK